MYTCMKNHVSCMFLSFYRRNKVVNHFSIMLQRRLREQERGDDDEDETEKGGKKKKKGGRKGGDLLIHDLDEDLEMSSDDSDSSMGEGREHIVNPHIYQYSVCLIRLLNLFSIFLGSLM